MLNRLISKFFTALFKKKLHILLNGWYNPNLPLFREKKAEDQQEKISTYATPL